MVQVKSPKTGMIEYDMTVGMTAMEGRGFYYPSDVAIGRDGPVPRRSTARVESVDRGVRVTMCDIASEYYGIFGTYGQGDGQFVWASCAAIDSQDRVYITDEYLSRVSVFDPDGKLPAQLGRERRGEKGRWTARRASR